MLLQVRAVEVNRWIKCHAIVCWSTALLPSKLERLRLTSPFLSAGRAWVSEGPCSVLYLKLNESNDSPGIEAPIRFVCRWVAA